MMIHSHLSSFSFRLIVLLLSQVDPRYDSFASFGNEHHNQEIQRRLPFPSHSPSWFVVAIAAANCPPLSSSLVLFLLLLFYYLILVLFSTLVILTREDHSTFDLTQRCSKRWDEAPPADASTPWTPSHLPLDHTCGQAAPIASNANFFWSYKIQRL